jgi:hypothetical protein
MRGSFTKGCVTYPTNFSHPDFNPVVDRFFGREEFIDHKILGGAAH